MGYFKDTLRGVLWMGVLRGSTHLTTFIKIAVLARILSPEKFGLFGIATLLLTFLEILTETGINIFFIQGEGEIKDYLNTVWIISILRGGLIALIMLLSAPIISSFFNLPESRSLLRLIAVVPLLRGFINPAIVKFQKELRFNKEFQFRFIIFAFDAIVTIIIAMYSLSASSLIWGLIAGAVLEVSLSLLFVKPKPNLEFELPKFQRVIKRGKWVTGFALFDYIFRQGDDIVVGKLLNATSLGLYQVAYKISSLPITEVADVFAKVTFPIYTRIVGDTDRVKAAFLRTMMTISLFAIPIGVLIFMFPEKVISIVLGSKWLSASDILKVLAVCGVVRAIVLSANSIFLAAKKQEYVTISSFAGTLGLAVTIIPLVRNYGIMGAGYSTLIGTLVSVPVTLWFVFRIFKSFK